MSKQDYYFAGAEWTENFNSQTYEKKHMLKINILKLRQPYSQPEKLNTIDEDAVIERQFDQLEFDSVNDSKQLSKLAGYVLKDIVVKCHHILLQFESLTVD